MDFVRGRLGRFGALLGFAFGRPCGPARAAPLEPVQVCGFRLRFGGCRDAGCGGCSGAGFSFCGSLRFRCGGCSGTGCGVCSDAGFGGCNGAGLGFGGSLRFRFGGCGSLRFSFCGCSRAGFGRCGSFRFAFGLSCRLARTAPLEEVLIFRFRLCFGGRGVGVGSGLLIFVRVLGCGGFALGQGLFDLCREAGQPFDRRFDLDALADLDEHFIRVLS